MTTLRHRLDELRHSFWLLPGIGIAAGLVLGFGLVELDYALDLDPGVFTFVDVESSRAVLQTIATVTVSVAGLAFSVTLVALQLASQQLSPRVLRTFQGDRIAQSVLAAFVGTFVYALIVLAKLTEQGVPALALTVAILGAVAAFGLFVAFIHRIVVSLKASTVIARIARDGRAAIDERWPAGAGRPVSGDRPPQPTGGDEGAPVRAPAAGFVAAIDGPALVALAEREDLLVRQRAPIGHFVVTGDVLATVHGPGPPSEEVAGGLRAAFTLKEERSVTGDVGFPVRQLADIALRALSPSLNDPTTAVNAIATIADLIIHVARSEAPEPVRAGGDGRPRLVALVPGPDELVRLGFDQVRLAATEHPAVAHAVIERLTSVDRAAREQGHEVSEPRRQARLLADVAARAARTQEEAVALREAPARHGLGA
jgi:uncharacterized membrane protein